MKFVQSFDFNKGDLEAMQIPCIKGRGAPNAQTEGAVGLFYMDISTGAVYKCVATDGESGVYEWKETDRDQSTYYPNISTAINDISNGVETNALPSLDNACVKVFIAENGRLTISLLADVSESTTITVSKDIDLVLAGHTITFTTAEAHLNFAAGTSCTINGEVAGSQIVKGFTGSSKYTTTPRLVYANGEKLAVCGGEYELTANYVSNAYAVGGSSTAGLLELLDCHINVTNSTETLTGKPTTRCVVMDGGDLVMRDTVCECVTNVMQCCALDLYKSGTTTIERCDITAKSTGNSAFCRSMWFNATGEPKITDTKCYCEAIYGQVCAVFMGGLDTATIKGCELRAINSNTNNEGECTGVSFGEGGTLHITDTLIHADAPGSNATQTSSVGVRVPDDAEAVYLENTKVYATHSGVSNYSNLYVKGCILSGWSHGGLYTVHDSTKAVVVKDTQLWNGYYDGKFPLEGLVAGGLAGNCYFGYWWYEVTDGSTMPGGDSYMDGCVFEYKDPSDEDVSEAFVVRDTGAGDTPNRLFISNSEFIKHQIFRARGEDGYTPAEVYIGTGCNFDANDVFTREDIPAEGSAIIKETNALYRKHYTGEELTAEDFDALVAFMNGAGVS